MKFLNLVYEGYTEKSGVLEFGNKIQGIIPIGENADFTKDLLSAALYGDSFAAPAKFILSFSHNDGEYVLTRTYAKEAEGVKEYASVTENGADAAEGAEAVLDFMEKLTSLTKNNFKELFAIDKSDIASALAGNGLKRESFITAKLARLEGVIDIGAKVDVLKKEETALLNRLERITPATKDEISAAGKLVKTRKAEVEKIEELFAEVNTELTRAQRYDELNVKLYEETARFENLSADKEKIESLVGQIKVSKESAELSGIYEEYNKYVLSTAEDKEQLEKKNKKLDALAEKYNSATGSLKNYEKIYIRNNERKNLTQDRLQELIKNTEKEPEGYKIYDVIDSYYSEIDGQIAALTERNKEIDGECAALTEKLDALDKSRTDIRKTAAYKKAVSEGAVLESVLNTLKRDIDVSIRNIEDYTKERDALTEEKKRLEEKIRTLQNTEKELSKAIKGKFASFKDAVNADVFYKQTIYSKHLLVSANEVEIDAIEKKIAEFHATNENYKFKLDEAAAKKAKIEEHIKTLNDKLSLLQNKRLEYESFNRMRNISDDILFGERCPVCDNYVTVKKELPQKNTKDLDAQIEAVKAELTRCETITAEVDTAIGNYSTSEKAGRQYVESLIDTKAQKQAIVNGILSEYEVKTIPEFFNKVRLSVEKSKALTHNLDKYNLNEAELFKTKEAEQLVSQRLNRLEKEILVSENENYNTLWGIFTEKTAAYDKLQPVLNGENADALMLKLQVIAKEYETLEDEIVSVRAKIKELNDEREENAKIILYLVSRHTPLGEREGALQYQQVVVKSVMADLSVLVFEIEKYTEENEVAKLRLSALSKIVKRTGEEIAGLKNEIAALTKKIESEEQFMKDITEKYSERFTVLGITDVPSLEANILPDATLEVYQAAVDAYENDTVRMNQTIADISKDIEANLPYHSALPALKEKHSEIKSGLISALSLLTAAETDLKNKQTGYASTVDTNRKLSYIQAKIKKHEDIDAVEKDKPAIDVKKLTDYIINTANGKIKNWSKGKYYIEVWKDSIVLIDSVKCKSVAPSKFNAEERALMDIGLALACNEVILNTFTADIIPSIALSEKEYDKGTVSVLLEACKEKEIIVIPESEQAFYKSISKLA